MFSGFIRIPNRYEYDRIIYIIKISVFADEKMTFPRKLRLTEQEDSCQVETIIRNDSLMISSVC